MAYKVIIFSLTAIIAIITTCQGQTDYYKNGKLICFTDQTVKDYDNTECEKGYNSALLFQLFGIDCCNAEANNARKEFQTTSKDINIASLDNAVS